MLPSILTAYGIRVRKPCESGHQFFQFCRHYIEAFSFYFAVLVWAVAIESEKHLIDQLQVFTFSSILQLPAPWAGTMQNPPRGRRQQA